MSENDAEELLFSFYGFDVTDALVSRLKARYTNMVLRAHTTSRFFFTKETHISLSSPLDEEDPRIMMGMDKSTGFPWVIKFIPTPDEDIPYPTASSAHHLYNASMELRVARLESTSTHLVRCEQHSSHAKLFSNEIMTPSANKIVGNLINKDFPKTGLVMHHYPRTAATFSPINDDTLADLIRPIGDALAFLHGKNIIHMDIKPANIFIRMNRVWELGDFSAACPENMPIRATTPSLHLTTTALTTTATPQHDWGMLLCTLAALMNNDGLKGMSQTILGASNAVTFGQFLPATRTEIFSRASGKLAALIADWTALAGDK